MSKTLSAEAEHKPYFTTKRMALIGVMTAVTCILGPFSIPLPFSPVPISFTNLAIYLAAYVLGMKACTVSYLIYMLLGMVGVPVFSGFTAGVGKLAGPTGVPVLFRHHRTAHFLRVHDGAPQDRPPVAGRPAAISSDLS